MKKIFLFITIFSLTLSAYSQKVYGEYTTSKGVITIKSSVVVKKGKTQGSVYLDLNKDGKTSMNFKTENSRLDFLNFVNRTYKKFKEWKATAEENQVKDMTKDIDEAMLGDNIAFLYGEWKFSFGKNKVRASMSINTEGKVTYYLYIPKVKASDNQFMESDSQLLIMEDSDIESLNNVLSKEVIDAFIKKANLSEDLFN